jgi:manganese/zinc/iron transport system substrate-binding protein
MTRRPFAPHSPRLAALLAAGLGALLSGCGDPASDAAAPTTTTPAAARGTYRVVTTTAMIGDIARNVAGTRAEVESLMGPGVDPHLYRPTRSDISRLLEADIVFYNGLNLEGKMTDTFVQVAAANRHVYAVTAGIQQLEPEYLLEPPAFAGHYDPHVWMDPRGWIRATEVVVEALCGFDPARAGEYRAAAEAYATSLRRLDAYAHEALSSVPAGKRVLVTAHDAFNYFARAYSVEVQGIQGISTESEAGLKRIEALVDLLVDRRIGAVFTETSVSEKNIRALVEGAEARGHRVAIGGTLFSDAMGAPGTYEGTYLGMIDHNVTTIVRALGGDAPPGGMDGKLGAAHP